MKGFGLTFGPQRILVIEHSLTVVSLDRYFNWLNV